MGAFGVGKITEAGRALLSEALAGPGIIFTRMEIADGSGNKHSMNIDRVLQGDCLTVEATAYSGMISKGFWVVNLNLFAQSRGSDEEVLFMTTIDKNPDYMPSKNDETTVTFTYAMKVAINNTDKITLARFENGMVNIEMLNDILLSKELPIKFTVDNNGDVIVEENKIKVGIPNYVKGDK